MPHLRAFVVILILAGAPLLAQGLTDFPNYEDVKVKPIAVAMVDGHEFLLVCNTPDNSVEIYDTDDESFLARVPVGQGPVSVAWNGRLGRFYTANMFGDSVSAVALEAPAGVLSWRLVETTYVGDEPVHLAFYPLPVEGGPEIQETLFVTHYTSDRIDWRDALTLAPLSPGLPNEHAQTGVDLDGDGTADVEVALKEPRTVAVAGDRVVAIATKGGNSAYDNDVWCADLVTMATRQHGELGSFNANMVFDSQDNMWSVGSMALNGDLIGGPDVKAATTGFVTSMVYFVEDVCTDDFTVASRDLNAVPGAVIIDPVTGETMPAPVPQSQSLAMPMDIVVMERDGEVKKAFIAAFSIDRIGVLAPDFSKPIAQWQLGHIDVGPIAGNPTAAPRGLALKTTEPLKLYVLNHNDNSVEVIDPLAEAVIPGAGFALANDPRPAAVREGHHFIAGAQFSGNHFVSCFSCHIDMRTDRLRWALGDPDGDDVPLPDTLNDATEFTVWPADKGFMVTQTLQGLINWQVEEEARRLFTNAPYHWRGDREDIEDFNEAFVSLLGDDDELSPAEMAKAARYVRTILLPGNPKQPPEREFSGTFGPTADADDLDVGTEAQHGMKIFFMKLTVGRSCVTCHALPDGSNNHLTEGFAQPIETAELRFIFQREARVDKGRDTLPSDAPLSGITGLTHTGITAPSPFDDPPFNEIDLNATATIDAFDRFTFSFFLQTICATQGDFCDELKDVNRFVHEFDTGTSSLAGAPFTVSLATDPGLVLAVVGFMETQAGLANLGLAVNAFIGGTVSGYWYDLTGVVPAYRAEPGGQTLDLVGLYNLLSSADDRLVFQATPLGAERRIAAPTGVASALANIAPSGLSVKAWRPNTAYDHVPLMTEQWANFNNGGLGSFYIHKVRTLQHAIRQEAISENAFGLTGLRHEAPRRAVVAGRQIQHGARLEIYLPDDPSGLKPDLTKGPRAPGQIETLRVSLPIYPTDEIDSENRVIWQTAVEMAPFEIYKRMVGGDYAPGVDALLNDTGLLISEPPPAQMFDPLGYGWAFYRVVNPGGVGVSAGWQRISLSAPPI